MARISGIDLPSNKKVKVALTYIYGIGNHNALNVLQAAKVDPEIKVKDLKEEQITSIQKVVSENFVVEGDLRKEVTSNIRRYMEINCYRGMRHKKGLPVRGQRTKTNARTRKGPKKTIGSKAGGK